VSNNHSAWDAVTAVRTLPVIPWSGFAWRFHRRTYEALDPAGSLRVPGRFHRGRATLYLALGPHVALGERLRHLDPDDPRQLASLNEFRLTRLRVRLGAVLDCCERRGRRRACGVSAIPGLSLDDLCLSADLVKPPDTPSQRFGEAAYLAGVEGLLVPSCTRFASGNLVVFPENLRPDTVLAVVGSEEPTLFAGR